jgi:hypothetical protein
VPLRSHCIMSLHMVTGRKMRAELGVTLSRGCVAGSGQTSSVLLLEKGFYFAT